MSPNLYQGFQSCLEPRITEPHILRLKLTQPRRPHNPLATNLDLPCFPQSLTINEPTNNTVYIHPDTNLSPSKLSEKSLEMCTESLGSETGSTSNQCSDDIALLSLQSRTQSKIKATKMPKKVNGGGKFPPPLTSISGSNGVQVMPHREGGRLLLKVVIVCSSPSCFHVKREGGRLRLRLWENCADFEADDEKDVDEGEVYRGGNDEIGKGSYYGGKRRCKEGGCGNKEMLNWEPFWVSTWFI